jgi:hypothetical protein
MNGAAPKTVLYYLMEKADQNDLAHISDRDEINAVEWMTPKQAIDVLTHPEDRELVAAVFGIARGYVS